MKKCAGVFFTILVFLALFSCSQKETDSKSEKQTVHVARYANFTPSRIFPDQSIDIGFGSPMIEVFSVGTKIEKDILEFEPEIDGESVWKSDRIISFVPSEELSQGEKFKAILKLNKLDEKYKDVADYKFEFLVNKRDVRSFTGDIIELKNNKAFYEADIIFNYKTDIDELKKATSLTMNGKAFPFELLPGADKATFKMKTAEFTQSNDKKLFNLFIDQNKIEIASDFSREFSFTKKQEMEVVQVSRKTDNDNPSIEILFASELSPDQDINGLINITPIIDFEPKKIGKTVTLTGNFEYGKEYTVTVNGNIMNSSGFKLNKEYVQKIEFLDKAPKLEFLDKGCFLSSGNNKKIRFNTLNIKELQLVVKKVYETNLGQFLQRSSLRSSHLTSYYNYRGDYGDEFNKVGIEVKRDTLKIGVKTNEMITNELDLNKLIPQNDKGLYVLELYYNEENTLFRRAEGYSRYDRRYPQLYGKAVKNIVFTNMGMNYIKSENGSSVYVFDLETTNPVSNAKIKLLDYQNQVLSDGSTNYKGKAEFGKTPREPFYITAEKSEERSVLKLNEMKTNFSAFDIGGAVYSPDKTRGYIYTERGVYRPGDEINISMIFRNKDNTFPKDHPVKIKITNPVNKVVSEEVIKKGEDGFYNYNFKTAPEDMTGTWNLTAEAGGEKFYKSISIETIVPEVLEVNLTADKDSLSINDEGVNIKLASKYLFGNPASNLRAEVTYKINGKNRYFSKYNKYYFGNELLSYSGSEGTFFKGNLDNDGNKTTEFKLPKILNIPSAAAINLSAEVLEEGGRPNKSSLTLSYDPYDSYIGIERNSGYVKAGNDLELKTILLAPDGYALQGREMTVKIYLNERYWWWDYGGRNNRMNFRSDFETRQVYVQDFTSGENPYSFKYNFKDDGLYLIEVSQKVQEAHSCAYFIQASYWGGRDKDINSADFQALRSDKPVYEPGETAIVKFPAPDKARVLVSIDMGSVNLDSYSFTAKGKESKVEIPIKSNMVPNIYCTVTVIQPNSSSDNDRPVRITGTIPISVNDPETVQKLNVTIPEYLRPNETFKCKIHADGETQFTIAVVDEGLLSITDFTSPDAWKNFYQKIRLGVGFYDLYGFVIGANKGPVSNTFSVGGGLAERAKMLNDVNANRFKPVSLFKGPLKTDKNGNAEVEFTMPEYVGAVRVMAVSANKGKYGSFEKLVKVKTELIAMPSVPRVMTTGDEVEIPVIIFSMDEKIKETVVQIELGGVLFTEETSKKITFAGIENKTVYFKIRAKDQVGKGDIKITAKSGSYKYESNTEIAVKPLAPREFRTITKAVEKGGSVNFHIPEYISSTVNSSVTISKIKMPDINKRLGYLIGYPYGCLEQTVSKGFSQLSVKPLLKQHSAVYEEIDKNINSAISKLRSFQNSTGSFNYWPDASNYYSGWSDIYAGHFLTEAKKKGYFVPTDMYDNWKRSEHSYAIKCKVENFRSVINRKNESAYYNVYYRTREQLYRLYVLAIAGEPEIGAMNIMKETNLSYLDDAEKWMLAMSYKLAGINETANSISNLAGILVEDYTEMSGSFGTADRDKAVILTGLCEAGNEAKAASLYSNLVDRINSDEWLSTQTLGFVMLSIGKFMEKYPEYFNVTSKLSGRIVTERDGEVKFKFSDLTYTKELESGSKDIVTVTLDKDTEAEKCFVSLNYDAIPLKPADKREGKGIYIERTFITKSGKTGALKTVQGETFTMKIKIKKSATNELKNMALVQILPSGWEIENARLENRNAYTSASTKKNYGYSSSTYNYSQQIRYTDIRDDRVMWFFDMEKQTKEIEFVIELRAVSVGKFYLSPTVAESMYSKDFFALEPGMKVEVVK